MSSLYPVPIPTIVIKKYICFSTWRKIIHHSWPSCNTLSTFWQIEASTKASTTAIACIFQLQIAWTQFSDRIISSVLLESPSQLEASRHVSARRGTSQQEISEIPFLGYKTCRVDSRCQSCFIPHDMHDHVDVIQSQPFFLFTEKVYVSFSCAPTPFLVYNVDLRNNIELHPRHITRLRKSSVYYAWENWIQLEQPVSYSRNVRSAMWVAQESSILCRATISKTLSFQ